MIDRKLLAKIHIARKDMRLEEEDYRAILERLTGKRSAADLSVPQLEAVLDHLASLGWKPPVRPFKKSGKPHVRKIYAIWKAMCGAGIPESPTREALHAFVLRQTKVANPEWLSPEQANQVTEGLKAWEARILKSRNGERKTAP